MSSSSCKLGSKKRGPPTWTPGCDIFLRRCRYVPRGSLVGSLAWSRGRPGRAWPHCDWRDHWPRMIPSRVVASSGPSRDVSYKYNWGSYPWPASTSLATGYRITAWWGVLSHTSPPFLQPGHTANHGCQVHCSDAVTQLRGGLVGCTVLAVMCRVLADVVAVGAA